MKALNRKSSTTSLSTTASEIFPLNVPHESRGSVPPDHKLASSTMTSPRAKSMSKEPFLPRDNSLNSQKSNSSVFHSLSRRIAKFRSSSTQPSIKTQLSENDYPSVNNLDERGGGDISNMTSRQESVERKLTESMSSQREEESDEVQLKSRDRTLSPAKILRGLRARSPFARVNKTNPTTKSSTPNLTATTLISGKNKSFTVGSSVNGKLGKPPIGDPNQSNSISSNLSEVTQQAPTQTRLARATTAGPPSKSRGFGNLVNTLTTDKMRSASCEFIDNNHTTINTGHTLNKLNETLDEDDESNYETSSNTHSMYINTNLLTDEAAAQLSPNDKRSKKAIGLSSFNTSQSSQVSNLSRVELLKKNFDTMSTSSHDVVKSVKFREPMDKPEPQDTSSSTPNRKLLKNQEFKLMQVLDKALVSTPASLAEPKPVATPPTPPPTVVITTPEAAESTTGEDRTKKIKFGENDCKKTGTKLSPNQKFKSAFNIGGGSTTSVDKPPKPPTLTNANQAAANNLGNAFGIRSKLSGFRSRTMDAYDSHKAPEADEAAASKPVVHASNETPTTPLLNSAGKPLQSILRRSETPPVSKTTLRQQTSIDSHRSYREESIEKILNASSSTSRPLMFKN